MTLPKSDAILEHRVDAEHAAVERDGLLAAVDAEQAGDATAPQEPEAVGHQLRVAGRLDDEVEAAELRASRRVASSRRSARRRPRRAGFAGSSDAVHTSTPSSRSRIRRRACRSRRRRSRARARAATAGGSPIVRAWRSARSQIEVGSASTPSRPSAAGSGSTATRILGDELAREAVEPRDPALDVVAGEARVRRVLRAGEAVAARAAHGRGDEVAAAEAVAVASTTASSSWPSTSSTRPRARRRRGPRRSRGRCRRRRPRARGAAPRRPAATRARRRPGSSGRRPGSVTSACIRPRSGRRRSPARCR